MPQAFLAFCNFSMGKTYTGELGLLSGRRISWRICARERPKRRVCRAFRPAASAAAKTSNQHGLCRDNKKSRAPAGALPQPILGVEDSGGFISQQPRNDQSEESLQ
jgi:hypothetical protein